MKTKYNVVAAALLLSIGVSAQKDEFKTLKKIYEKEKLTSKDVAQYKTTVEVATPLVNASNKEDVAYLNFYKASIPFIEVSEAMTKPENQVNPTNALQFFTTEKIEQYCNEIEAILNFESAAGKPLLTKSIQDDIVAIKPFLFSYAASLDSQKRMKDASIVLHSLYKIDKKDLDNLYYAAAYAVNAKEYTTAYSYYKILKDLNYSGEKVNYSAISKINDKSEVFANKEYRDKAVAIGTHITPKDEKEPSKRGEIYKNMALILISEGKTNEAILAVQDARKANPDDVSLISSEADLYLKTNDMARYTATIKEVIEKDPKNPELFYNLGVTSYKNKDFKNAETYYLKSIELNPQYADAYYAMGAIRLDEGQVLLDQMNKLGTTPAENKKYDILREQRIGIIKEGMKNFEKCIELDAENVDAKEVLLSVYKALEMKDKAKALQDQLDK